MIRIKGVLLISIVVLFFTGVFVFSSRYPTIAIRKHLFLSNPMQAFTCNIQPTARLDFGLGQLYIINGFVDASSGEPIHFAHVKRNSLGLYYWGDESSESNVK